PPEPLPAPGKSAPHRPHRPAEPASRLLVRQALEVAELDRDPILLGEAFELAGHHVPEVGELGLARRVGGRPARGVSRKAPQAVGVAQAGAGPGREERAQVSKRAPGRSPRHRARSLRSLMFPTVSCGLWPRAIWLSRESPGMEPGPGRPRAGPAAPRSRGGGR